MTDIDVLTDAIRARLAAATPAPWARHDFGSSGSEEPETIIIHAGTFDWQSINDEGDYIVATPRWDVQESANAEFIVSAPADIAALLAEVDSLRVKLAEQTAIVDAVTMISRDSLLPIARKTAKIAAVLMTKYLHKDES